MWSPTWNSSGSVHMLCRRVSLGASSSGTPDHTLSVSSFKSFGISASSHLLRMAHHHSFGHNSFSPHTPFQHHQPGGIQQPMHMRPAPMQATSTLWMFCPGRQCFSHISISVSIASSETALDPAIKLFEDRLPPPPGPSIDPKIIRGWADGMKGACLIYVACYIFPRRLTYRTEIL